MVQIIKRSISFFASACKAWLVLWSLFCFVSSFSQHKTEKDSLFKVLKTEKDTLKRAGTYGRIAWLSLLTNLPAAESYNDSAYFLFNELKHVKGIALSNYRYSTIMRYKGSYNEALGYIDKYLDYKRSQEDTFGLADGNFQKGNIYAVMGKPENALNFLYKSLEYYAKVKDSSSIGFTLNSIGVAYKDAGKEEDAIKAYKNSIKILENINDPYNLADSYANLGNIYARRKDFDRAIEYYEKTYALDSITNNNWGMGNNALNIGNMLIEQQRYSEALASLEKAAALLSANSNAHELAEVMTSEGIAHLKLGNIRNSLQALNNALNIAPNSFELKRDIHLNLFQAYNEKLDYRKALEHFREHAKFGDSVVNAENIKSINKLKLEYESVEKDRALAEQNLQLQEQENRLIKKQNQYLLALTGGGIFLLGSIGLWFYYRQRQKLKNKEISNLIKEKEIVSLEALINGEEQERKRIAQDLHDGINGDLSAIKYKISAINTDKLSAKQQQTYQSAMDMLDNSCEQIRLISHNLAPSSLQNFSLEEALKQHCLKLGSNSNISIDFQFYGTPLALNKEVEIIIYRMVQEIVNNIVKHSGATEALVLINNHGDVVNITVEDNGIGFDPKSVSGGLGLQNIRSRVDFLNAEMELNSDNTGTTYHININLDTAATP